MLLNLNNKFKFFLAIALLFSSLDTLAGHLSILIDDKESPIHESLIIKDVISIGAVPSSEMRTGFPLSLMVRLMVFPKLQPKIQSLLEE